MTKPNILYLHTHDCGRFVSPCGYDMPSPNLMQLARQGTTFRQACSGAPTCSPSRATLLTGEYPHVNGMHGLAWNIDRFPFNDEDHHLVRFLKAQGYDCALAGRNHLSRYPLSRIGYDRVLDHMQSGALPEEVDPGVPADRTSPESVAAYLDEPHDRPFFLAVGFGAPHRYGNDRRVFDLNAVYVPPERDLNRYARPLPIFPDNAISRNETANFQEGVRIMDTEFGAVLDALNASAYRDNTLVITTTDHGAGFPGMKCTLTDWGIGVFLVMRGPGVPAGAVLDSLVSHVDIFPTIADLLGAPRPPWLQGTSLLPLLNGEREQVNDCIFAEQGYHGGYRPLRAVRTARHKLIRCFLPNATKADFWTDRGPICQYLKEVGVGDHPVPEYALYDLEADPLERCNQADNPAYAGVFADLKARLDRYMRDTNDPLLAGPLPPSPAMQAQEGKVMAQTSM